jgi:MFS family permease
VTVPAPTTTEPPPTLRQLPRNVWAASLASFFTDISSEMVLNLLPLYLANVLGVRTDIIGVIEGVAESTASLLKIFSGWISDRLHARKWPAVVGYGLSTLSKPFFLIASTWQLVALVRWADRVGKGVRTAPRDALVADSIEPRARGLAFGFHRAADTAGAVLGLVIALLVVWAGQSVAVTLTASTFQRAVLISLTPAALAVLVLAFGAREVPVTGQRARPRFAARALGKPFLTFLLINGLFALGNSSDAFLVLRAQDRGLSVTAILAMLVVFNLVYTLISTPAGQLSDRIGRRRLIVTGWLIYAAVYLGFALAQTGWHAWVLYVVYGLYYGLAYGTSKALIADLVPEGLRATAFGTHEALQGLMLLPASIIAGVLWQGVGAWPGLGPWSPFAFGAVMALAAAVWLALWRPPLAATQPLAAAPTH